GDGEYEAYAFSGLWLSHGVRVGVVRDLAFEDVEARRDGPVEQVGLGDRELVVLRALPGLGRELEGLARAQEVRGREGGVDERALEAAHPAPERELVAVLLLDLERDVELVLALRAGAEVGRAL